MAWMTIEDYYREKAQNVPSTSPTNTPEEQQASADAQDESWLHMIGRSVKEAALPTLGGLGGAAVGSVLGPGGTIAGEMAGSAGGEWLNQKLGITNPQTSLTGADPRTEQILMAGAIPGLGRLAGGMTRAALKSTMGGRVLGKELATEALGRIDTTAQKMAPSLYEDVQNFFRAAKSSGKMVEFPSSARLGDTALESAGPKSFEDAAQAVSNLKTTIAGMESRGEDTAMAKYHLGKITSAMESEYPGWSTVSDHMDTLAKTGQDATSAVSSVRPLINKSGPLAEFEQALSMGGVKGIDNGGVHLLPVETQNEIRGILAKLGPAPGNHAITRLIEGRALGHVAGALFSRGAAGGAAGAAAGYASYGMVGGAVGMLAGMLIPQAFDSMIAKSMAVPALRSFVKQSIDAHMLGKPEFWIALGQMGTKLVGNTFVPQLPPDQPQMPPQQMQPQPDQGQGQGQ
jgi:hypothetical protein